MIDAEDVAVVTPLVGAYEADAWAGLAFVLGHERGLALRLSVDHDGRRLDPRDLFMCARNVGPCAPDGEYARVAFDLTLPVPATGQAPIRADADSALTLTWEWARLDAGTVAIRVSSCRALVAHLECAAPWGWTATWEARSDGAAGWCGAHAPQAGREPDLVVRVLDGPKPTGRLPLAFNLGDAPAVLVAGLAGHEGADVASPRDVADAIDRAAARYEAARPRVTGAWHGLAASIANTVQWMVLLQPEHLRRYVPAGRRWIFPRENGGRDDWTIFAWDGFFNALLLSHESPALSREMLAAVIGTQYPSGNIPNWRGRYHGTADRSQPPVGSFIVLKLALRTGDRTFVHEGLPGLDRWHAWWARRRRPSGLYAWGSTLADIPPWVPEWERDASHPQKAAWESGQDDLPNWDGAEWDAATSTLAMDCVDLSALVALDAECLAHLHDLAGDASRAHAYRAEHAEVCRLIDEHLWDDARGVYADRLADGSHSARVAATNFLPLLAGAGAGSRTSRALATLLDPGHFWGRWIVPTIDRRDPAFADQQYWRGTIWPPTNFLLYEALRRVRADEAAADLADRSVALFVGDWRAHQVSRENFSAIDGVGGGQRHQSWGPLFSWTGLAEFIDVTPWDGLRIGAVVARSESRAERLRIAGHTWDVGMGPHAMRVSCDGRVVFESDVPVCLRAVTVGGSGWSADVESRGEARVWLPDGQHLVVGAGTTHLVCASRGADNPP